MTLGWLGCLAFATVAVNPAAMIPSGDAAVAGVRPFANSAHALAQSFSLSALLFYPFFACLSAGMSIARDEDANVTPLLLATPLSPGEYLLGKIGGTLGYVGSMVAAHVSFAMVWYEAGVVVGSLNLRGPFALSHYIQPALFFLAPGAILSTTLGFAVGSATRSILATACVPLLLFFLGIGGLIPRAALSGPTVDALLSITDVWGVRWLSRTVFANENDVSYFNSALVRPDLAFASNRIFVLIVSVAVGAWLWRNARRIVHRAMPARSRGVALPVASMDASEPPHVTRHGAVAIGRPSNRRAFTSLVHVVLRTTLARPSFLGLVAICVVACMESVASAIGVLETARAWSWGSMAVHLVETITFTVCLALLFMVSEAIAAPRRARVEALTHATAVPSATFVAAIVGSAFVTTLVVLATSGIAAGWVARVSMGPEAIALIAVWGGALGPTFFAWVVFVVLVACLVGARAGTLTVGIVTMGLTAALHLSGRLSWATNWVVWDALRWSDFGGAFGLHRDSLLLNRVLWLLVGLTLLALCIRCWPRIERDGGRPALERRSAWPVALAAGSALAVAILLIARVEAGPDGSGEAARRRAYWDRNVRAWGNALPPTVRHLEAAIVFHPDEGEADVDGWYAVVNDTGQPLTRMAFTVDPSMTQLVWSVDGRATTAEDRSGLNVVTLSEPLPPAGISKIGFRYRLHPQAEASRRGGSVSRFITPSGLLLDSRAAGLFPTPGFVVEVGADRRVGEDAPMVTDEEGQKLPPLEGPSRGFTVRLSLESPHGFVVTGVGSRVSRAEADGSVTEVFESRVPLRHVVLVGGPLERRGRGVVEVAHLPEHARIADEVLAVLDTAHRRYTEWFGPYPWTRLTLTEFPDFDTRARSYPTSIAFSEGMGFHAADDAESVLARTVVVAHEAAHQWWGHAVLPGRASGADALVEGLADYATLLYLDAAHGDEARRWYARRLEDSVLDAQKRGSARAIAQTPLDGTAVDRDVAQAKGAWAFWMLDRNVGRDVLLEALRRVQALAVIEGVHPSLHDLLDEVRTRVRSVPLLDGAVHEWFETTTLPEFQVTTARAILEDGRWRVRASLLNVTPLSREVDVDVRLEPSALDQTVRVSPGRATSLEWISEVEPLRIVIDPRMNVLQRHRERAVATVGTLP